MQQWRRIKGNLNGEITHTAFNFPAEIAAVSFNNSAGIFDKFDRKVLSAASTKLAYF